MFTFWCRRMSGSVARPRARTTSKPQLETLEDRTLPTVLFPANNGFERPNLLSNGSGNYQYPLGGGAVTLAQQGGSGWTFTGLTGVADNGYDPHGNSFNVVGATNGNHDGSMSTFGQAALIQNARAYSYYGPSVISQVLTFAGDGNASVTFSIEQRDPAGNNPINVRFDNFDLGTYLAQSAFSFNTVTTPSVFLTAGAHTLSFTGTNTLGADNTQFIDNVSVNYNTSPDIVPTSLSWDTVQGGVDFGYQVSGGSVPMDTQESLYWSPTQTYDPSTATLIPGATQTIPAGTQPGSYGPFNESSNLIGAPKGTKYLLAVTDPNKILGNFDQTANVQSLPLVLPVQPVYQYQGGPWAVKNPGIQLGHSPHATIAGSGCALVSLDMALNYEGIVYDPLQLNNLLTAVPGGYSAGTGRLNWGPATAIAAGGSVSSIHWNGEDAGSSDPQDLRDLLTSNAAPVIVDVQNVTKSNPKPHDHFVLVKGIDGNTFSINDPGYASRTTLNAYGNHFTIVGSVTEPPSDISALYVTTTASGTGANLAITNPQGRVTGLPSGSGQSLTQIPNSVYFEEGPLENLDGPSVDNTTAQFVYISQPASGIYGIQTSGTTAPSQLEVAYAAPRGTLQSQQTIAGQSPLGDPLRYQVYLDPSHTLGTSIQTGGPMNVSSQVSATRSNVFYSHGDQFYHTTLTITNTSQSAISGDLEIDLQGLTAGVTLHDASLTINGTTYTLAITINAADDPVIQIPKNLLASLPPGKSVALTLRFSDPNLIRFGYTTAVFSDPSGS